MLNYIKTPSGDLIARHLLQRVSHIPKKGVLIKDGYDRMLAYIQIEDDAQAKQVRDLLNEVLIKGKSARQPDWSFLTAAPFVGKSPK